ncbi:hypothetical protein C815_00991 [Firmicutes bacterium M10-2]|nr:hypothetical protein C815_00991 [Firmicutes bacterium M10-2]
MTREPLYIKGFIPVIPTHVGMNPDDDGRTHMDVGYPYACRDESSSNSSTVPTCLVIPTHVGMNPEKSSVKLLKASYPYACRDESYSLRKDRRRKRLSLRM